MYMKRDAMWELENNQELALKLELKLAGLDEENNELAALCKGCRVYIPLDEQLGCDASVCLGYGSCIPCAERRYGGDEDCCFCTECAIKLKSK